MSTEAPVHANRLLAGNEIDWAPYLAGIGIGVLSWLVFVVVATPIGVTTAASQVAGGVAALVVGQDAVQANPYWARNLPRLDYGTLFLVGTFVGALASALASRSFVSRPFPRSGGSASAPLRPGATPPLSLAA